ncbi:MAG: bifunctional oligoribonuclease/PAP phosphatase NrnA [Cyclobacteriaceae bacterium]
MQNIEAFREAISRPQRIVITTHIKPDADALGSSLGLANYLISKGHHVQVITPTNYPSFLNWMYGNDGVLIFKDGGEQQSAELVSDADLIFCLDFSSLKRIEELGALVQQSPARKVLIDHHLDPEDFADFTLWNTNAAATAELVYELIKELDDLDKITPAIADCLYAGIMTDTGSFKHSSTSSNVHRIVADLIDRGANISVVSKLIYDNNSLSRLKLIGFALADRLTVFDNLKVAYITLSNEDLNRFNYQTGDTEGLVNYALSIKGIAMAAIIIEREDKVKLSFRSFGDVAVNDLARKYFNGGGHKNAAGGASDETLEETVSKFRKVVLEHRDRFVQKVNA